MIWFILFVIGLLCVPICVLSFAVWLATAVILNFLDCVEKSLIGFAAGHAITGLLYLVPAALFCYVIADGLYLMGSFLMAVLR